MKTLKKLTAMALLLSVCLASNGIWASAEGKELPQIEIVEFEVNQYNVNEFAEAFEMNYAEAEENVIDINDFYRIFGENGTNANYKTWVFKSAENGETYICDRGEIQKLGEYAGGNGVTSLAIADMDENGENELYFTYSWDFNGLCSQAGYYDFTTDNITYFDDYAYGNEMIFSDKDGTLGLYSAESVEYLDIAHQKFSPVEKIAEITLSDEGMTFRKISEDIVELAEKPESPPNRTLPDFVPKNFEEALKVLETGGNYIIKDNMVCFIYSVESAEDVLEITNKSTIKKPVSRKVYGDSTGNEIHVECFEMSPDRVLHFTCNGEYIFYCDKDGEITKPDESETFTISPTEITMTEGETLQLDFTLNEKFYDISVPLTYNRNDHFAILTADGKLTAYRAGECSIEVVATKKTDVELPMGVSIPERLYIKLTVLPEEDISAENRAEMDRLATDYNEYPRRHLELLGSIEENGPRITMEKLQEIIDNSENHKEIFRQIEETYGFPDLYYDGGMRSHEYWLDDKGSELIRLNDNGYWITYAKIHEDGTVLSTQNVYPDNTVMTGVLQYVSDSYVFYNNIQSDMENAVKGDANGDGMFTIADVVLFQNYLLYGSTDDVRYYNRILKSPDNVDLCKDGVLDVFDLALLKTHLVEHHGLV